MYKVHAVSYKGSKDRTFKNLKSAEFYADILITCGFKFVKVTKNERIISKYF